VTAEAAAMHDDEINLSKRTVRDLIRRHFPAWSDLSIREVRASGTVNAIFRIGPDLAGRFPLRRDDPKRLRDVLGRESRASAEFGLHSPFPESRTARCRQC
jgi:aminoglycoside phosphotransferase (APT) family kinase protein